MAVICSQLPCQSSQLSIAGSEWTYQDTLSTVKLLMLLVPCRSVFLPVSEETPSLSSFGKEPLCGNSRSLLNAAAAGRSTFFADLVRMYCPYESLPAACTVVHYDVSDRLLLTISVRRAQAPILVKPPCVS